MPIKNKLLSIVFPILCALLLISACGNSEQTKARHIQQGKEYLENAQHDKARIEFKNVLQIDPHDAEAHSLLGQIEEHKQNWRKVLTYYKKAIKLDPTLLQPHIRLGHFYLLQAASAKNSRNNTDIESTNITQAKKQVDAALQLAPRDIDALILSASLNAYQGNDEAISILQNILATNPANSEATLLLSRIYSKKKWGKQAEQLLKESITLSPEDTLVRMELAKFYASRKRLDDAIEIMQTIITLEPDSLGHRLSLASYYIQQDKHDIADDIYQDAIKISPDDVTRYLVYASYIKKHKGLNEAIDYLKMNLDKTANTDKEISFRLASLYQEADDIEGAIALLTETINESALELSGMHARKYLIAIYLLRDNQPAANRLIEEVLAENPDDHDVLLAKAKIYTQNKNYKEAITLLRMALKNQPDSADIIRILAESHLKNGEIHLAGDLLKRAIKINPDNTQSHLRLIRFMLASDESEQALERIEHVLQINPKDIDAILLKSDILMQMKKVQQVVTLLNKLKEYAPDNAEGWFRMGRVYKSLNKKIKARKEFITAFNKAPDSIDLLAELTDIEIELGEITSTKTRLQGILKEQPEHPEAHKFLGMTYLVENDSERAEKEFILHQQKSPDDIASYIQLANISYRKRDINQAAEYYLKARKIAPEHIGVLTSLANIRSIQREYDSAISLYENILTIQPDNAVATNNVAMLLISRKSDPDSLLRAKQLIEKSSQKEHPALLDTLGWTYYLMAKYDSAQSSLQKAITIAPRVPTFHYHIAMTYIKLSNNELAIKHLQTAINLGKFPETNKALSVLGYLVSNKRDTEQQRQ